MYQEDAQGNAQPLVPQDELQQQAATTMGTAGPQSSVRVQDLATISQKHVCCLSMLLLLVLVKFHGVDSLQTMISVAGDGGYISASNVFAQADNANPPSTRFDTSGNCCVDHFKHDMRQANDCTFQPT